MFNFFGDTMKKFLFFNCLALILCYSITSYAQNPECQWAQKIGGSYYDYTCSIAIDSTGNAYVAGTFASSTLSFNNGISLTNSGGDDGYLAKYNSDGICQWAEKIAGSSQESITTIKSDDLGNIYIIGHFNSQVLNFNNNIFLENSGNSDGFIAKYDSSGNCLWAEKIAGGAQDGIRSISKVSSGNVYVVGSFFSQNLYFNNGISLTNSGGDDGYLAKYNSDGICQWAEKIAGVSNDYASELVVNNLGDIFIAGEYGSSPIYFNNGINLNRQGSTLDAFIAKYDTLGICQWAQSIYGSSTDFTSGLELDNSGNVFVTGWFLSYNLYFSNGLSISNNSYGEYDSYIAKYNSTGICQWVNRIGGILSDFTTGIVNDFWGNTYICGEFESSVLNFNNNISLSNSGGRDGFFVKYNSNGVCQWAEKIAGASYDGITCLAIDDLYLYIGGSFSSQVLNFNNEKTLFNIGNRDGYIAKYNIADIADFSLSNGWNLISSNVLPLETAMETIFNQTENLVIVKNNEGQIYSPSFGINQIGNWDITQGYYVYVTSPSILQIEGILVNPLETPINLNQGWNLVSYLRNSEMLAQDALQGITGSMLFAKDKMGNIYHPGYGINNLGNMIPGQGYWIYMNAPAVLTFPGN